MGEAILARASGGGGGSSTAFEFGGYTSYRMESSWDTSYVNPNKGSLEITGYLYKDTSNYLYLSDGTPISAIVNFSITNTGAVASAMAIQLKYGETTTTDFVSGKYHLNFVGEIYEGTTSWEYRVTVFNDTTDTNPKLSTKSIFSFCNYTPAS